MSEPKPKRPCKTQEFIEQVALKADPGDCVIWPFQRTERDYPRIRRNGRMEYVNRYICALVHGESPTPEYQAAHSCGNGHLGCVNPHHLSWKTRVENAADKLIHGTDNGGERNGRAKLRAVDVIKIRTLKGRSSYQKIANKFGVSYTAIANIMLERTWHHEG